MKIRNGFVSNSSSSSFIIGFNKNLSEEEVIEKISNIELFKVSDKHILYNEIKRLCRYLVKDINNKEYKSYDEYIEGVYGYLEDDEEDKWTKKIKELFEKGFIFYSGSIYDDGNYTIHEKLLSSIEFNYQDENLYLEKNESR